MRYIYIILFIIPVFFPALTFSQSDGVSNFIRSKLEQLQSDQNLKISGEKIHNIEYISNLYQKNDYRQFWTKPEYAGDAITALHASFDDGLLPADYHIDAIFELQDEISAVNNESGLKSSMLADLDLLLTDGIIFSADHLLYGKIDPVSLNPTWNFGFAPIPDLNPESFSQFIIDREISARLGDLRPGIRLYDTLMIYLGRYRDIAARGGWETIPSGGKIEPGDRHERIPAIRARLQLTGELTSADSISSQYYDNLLENDIKAFQASHGLDPDGIIGAGTFRELNVPVEKRIESIRINMERVRWVARSLPDRYIVVNIAAFWLLMFDNGQVMHYTPVVVGKPLNKTPVFRDRMRYIEFNPTWTQPTSIVRNETIPKLKKDSLYLEKNHMVLLDTKGNIVPTSTLDIGNLSASRFPYMVRQEPGPWNALGEMKFMFPNKYDIYLHDTPSKSLFSKASRAYSHGCIRVSKPLDLAVKLLEGTEYDRKKIEGILATHVTTRVNLSEPMDILLMYWTCGVDRYGKLFFAQDIYERDPSVIRDLDKPLR
jgi:murein L,D-transpeptidase YcbB/YkuD